MKLSLNWLNEFVEIDVNPKVLAEKLTSAGFEVEEVAFTDKFLQHVVVGKIVEKRQHPNADKLCLCKVDIGSKTVQIVTGAPNIVHHANAEGLLVPVALDGADLANGVKIKPSKIRGEDSEGMFCSGEELGIDEHYYPGAGVDGILLLDTKEGKKEKYKPGTPIAKTLLLDDVCLEVSITFNRPDAMSVEGMAKEVAAVLGKNLLNRSLKASTFETKSSEQLAVRVESAACANYIGSVVEKVTICRSPLWLRARLFAVGIKPINTIVDITNYVLVECGQPMHAFDIDEIAKNKQGKHQIVVRQASKNEKLAALNGKEYTLSDSNLMIADEQKPLVIAGVIGGTNSCITEKTKTIVFESASFDRTSVRRTSRKLGVCTDSAARFMKGVCPSNCEKGMQRAAELVQQLGCGVLQGGTVGDGKFFDKSFDDRAVGVSLKEINAVLGLNLTADQMTTPLSSLGLNPLVKGDKLVLSVPFSRRDDIVNAADIAEEVVRVLGYDVYDAAEAKDRSTPTIGAYDKIYRTARIMKDKLVEDGFYETINYSFLPPNFLEKLNIAPASPLRKVITVQSPISDDMSVMRTTMAYSLCSKLQYNAQRGEKEVKLFEAGRIYEKAENTSGEPRTETAMLAFASSKASETFFTMKGVLENLLNSIGAEWNWVYSTKDFLHGGISADVCCGKTVVASVGKIHPVVARNFDLADVYYAEINLDFLVTLPAKEVYAQPLSKFPTSLKDMSFLVSEDTAVGAMLTSVKKACGNLLQSAELADVFRDKAKIGSGKAVTFRMKLSSLEKTLTDEEILAVMKKIERALSHQFGAALRGELK